MASKTYIAVHEVHLVKKAGSGKTKPQIEVIAPGEPIEPGAQADKLLSMGAIRETSDAELAAKTGKKPAAKKAPAKPAAKAGEEGKGTDEEGDGKDGSELV